MPLAKLHLRGDAPYRRREAVGVLRRSLEAQATSSSGLSTDALLRESPDSVRSSCLHRFDATFEVINFNTKEAAA